MHKLILPILLLVMVMGVACSRTAPSDPNAVPAQHGTPDQQKQY